MRKEIICFPSYKYVLPENIDEHWLLIRQTNITLERLIVKKYPSYLPDKHFIKSASKTYIEDGKKIYCVKYYFYTPIDENNP